MEHAPHDPFRGVGKPGFVDRVDLGHGKTDRARLKPRRPARQASLPGLA